MLDALEGAERDFGPVRGEPGGLVRIGFTTALGLHYVERLGELTSRYPALQLDCAMTDWQRDMVEDRLDLALRVGPRSEEHTSELQSLMRNSYAGFFFKKKNNTYSTAHTNH